MTQIAGLILAVVFVAVSVYYLNNIAKTPSKQ
jgi:hypothetical protein